MACASCIERPFRRVVAVAALMAALACTPVATTPGLAGSEAQHESATPSPSSQPRVDRAELMRVVRTLSSPQFEGRRTGTPGGLAARRFIRDEFKDIGLAPAGEDFLQPFTVTTSSTREHPLPRVLRDTNPSDAANVIGVVNGTQAGSRTLVVSAHYDHMGSPRGTLYPGADDNASGVAAMLAVAKYVRAHPVTHRVVFAALDAEEYGFQGATAFVKMPPVPISEIALNINFDMVSRNDRHEIYAAGTYHTPTLKPIVDEVQQRTPVRILFGHDRPATQRRDPEDWTTQSDHSAFHSAGIPFLYFGVEDHPDYHRPTDTADRIDPSFFGNVADMLLDVVITADRKLPRLGR